MRRARHPFLSRHHVLNPGIAGVFVAVCWTHEKWELYSRDAAGLETFVRYATPVEVSNLETMADPGVH